MGLPILVQYAFLVVIQTAYAWIYIHSPYLRTAVVVPTLFRLVAWTLPVCGIVMASGANPIDYFRLRNNSRKGVGWGIAIGLLVVLVTLAQAWLLRGHVRVRFNFGLNLWVPSVLFVGLTEEVVFRGYFLQELSERAHFWKANLMQAVLFGGIHVPGWLLQGHFGSLAGVRECAYVICFGLGLGYVLKRTNSLWACMLIHSFNNFAWFAIPV